MTLWGTITWDVARAGGFTAYILVTLSVAIGLALTLHWQTNRWPRIINSELHNFITLLALIFTGVHVLAVWVDPFTRFGWAEVFIPFVSHYRPLWMALGIVGLYLSLAVGLSTWLRSLIGYTWWRRLHLLTLATYLLVTVHGLGNGSDTRTWWGALIYTASIVLVGALLALRLLNPTGQSRRHPLAAGLTALTIVAVGLFAALGPMQSGWNVFANNGQGSGARGTLAAASSPSNGTSGSNGTSAANPYTAPFTADFAGTVTQTGPDANGQETIQLQGNLSGGASGYLSITLQGQTSGGFFGDDNELDITSTQVTLGSDASTPLYRGTLGNLDTGRQWRMSATLSSTASGSTGQVQLRITLRVRGDGSASGTVSGAPGNGTLPSNNGDGSSE